MKTIQDIIAPIMEDLERKKDSFMKYGMAIAMEGKDFHGLSDFANDMREIEAQMEVLKRVLNDA